ncbi:MAG: ABC transporter permease [Pseudomonadota bacterium]
MSMFDILSFGPGGWGDEMLRGALMTLLVAGLGFLGGNIIGAVVATARVLGPAPVRWLGTAYTTVVRGVPELLIIYLLFFGGGEFFRFIAKIFFLGGDGFADAFSAGVLALSVVSGAYSAEVFRGAVGAVPRGMFEAARAFGMRPFQMLRLIAIPQVLRYGLPAMANVWQLTLKDTALISVTGLVELMRTTDIAAGSTQRSFFFYTISIMIFLAFTALSDLLFRRAENFCGCHGHAGGKG